MTFRALSRHERLGRTWEWWAGRTGPLGWDGVLTAALVLGLIGGQLVLRQDEAGWNAKAYPHGMVTLDGHLVEWEWGHVDEAVRIIDGEVRAPATVRDQNIYRFVSAYLIALLREPLRSYYGGALASELVVWSIAAAALYFLALRATGSRWVAACAAVLTANGAGFIGYVGQVDAHPSAYAAIAVWLAAFAALFPQAHGGRGVFPRNVPAAACAGFLLCAAGYTMEVAYPLLLFAWVVFGTWALARLYREASLAAAVGALWPVAVLTVAFVGPYVGFRVLVEQLFDRVIAFNDPAAYLARHPEAIGSVGVVLWVAGLARAIGENWPGTFPGPLSVLAVAGAVAVPRRWLVWAATLLLVFCAAVALTKPTPRELFMVFPAVYLLAATGIVAGSRLAARIVERAMGYRYATGVTRAVVCTALVLAMILATNADVWGDYRLPRAWYTL